MSNLVDHARRELAGMINSDEEMDRHMAGNLIEIVEVFSKQGHSGFSGSYAIAVLTKLLNFEPLGPLTGEPDEWFEHGYSPDMKAQNKRCGHVFMRDDGTAYDSEGVVFREPGGSCFTAFHSRVDITFPYAPTKLYVDVPENSTNEQRVAAIAQARAKADK